MKISNRFNTKVKIGHRILLAFGPNLVYWLVLVAYAAYQLHTLHESLGRYDSNLMSSARVVHSVLDSVRTLHRHMTQHVMASTPAEMAAAETLLIQDRSRLEASSQGYRDLGTSVEDRADFDSILAQVQAYQQTLRQVLALSRDHANAEQHEAAVKLLLGDSRQAFDTLNDTATAWTTHNEAMTHERLSSSEARYQHGMKMLLTLSLLVVLSSLWSAISLSFNVIHPLRQAVNQAKAVARGDLTRRLVAHGENEMGQLFTALNEMTAQLSGLITDVLRSAQAVELAAGELAQSNEELSQRTQQQAGSLQETTASMHEITSFAKSNSDNAGHANQLTLEAREMAEAGGSVVAQAASAMVDINDGSAKIASITGAIDEIAFQTNLLALNAAVEAARAGEQGRGFAVVASEVRALAQRSATAAKQIKGLIRDSADKVRIGTELVDRSGQTLSQILKSVREMTALIHGIADSSREQSERVLSINESIVQLDGATQQNAALVEEGSAVTRSLRDQADALLQRASFFSVEQVSQLGAPIAHLRPAVTRTAGGASGARVKDPWVSAPALAREA